MAPAGWIASERGQAAVEAMRQAEYEWQSQPCDPAAYTPDEWDTFRHRYVLAALLSPGEQPCPECDGHAVTSIATMATVTEKQTGGKICRGSGTVPGVPAIIDAVGTQAVWVNVIGADGDRQLRRLHPSEVLYAVTLRRPEETP